VQSGEKLLVEKIEKGVVIDHITPCKGFLVYNIFNPDPDSTAVIAKNVPSRKYGRKDLVKIEGEYITSTLVNIIALIAPTATINIISDWKVKSKERVKPPEQLVGVIDCRNPACGSKGPSSVFTLQLNPTPRAQQPPLQPLRLHILLRRRRTRNNTESPLRDTCFTE
jgi:aspartate carbamoyltransferase regulatory subunit